jgi:hypothetical protein
LWGVLWGASAPLAWFIAFQAGAHPTFEQYGGSRSVVVFSVLGIVAIFAVRKLFELLESIQPAVRDLIGGGAPAEATPFAACSSTAGPLVASAVQAAIFGGVDFLRNPSLATALLFGVIFVWGIPIWTFWWMSGAIFLGLDRLGRMDLNLKPFVLDRSLGLRPLGRLAFQVFAMFMALMLPPIALATVEVRTTLILLCAIGAVVLLLFLSLHRLRRRLQAEKRTHLDACRQQIAQTLRDRSSSPAGGDAVTRLWDLHAAEAMERRALAIQEWPFDETVFVRIIAIATSVGTVILSRLVLLRIGL